MVSAIRAHFPNSTHLYCTRHIVQNALLKLTNDAFNKRERDIIMDKLFSEKGLLFASDEICFNDMTEDFETFCQSASPLFLRYYTRTLKQLLYNKVTDASQQDHFDWTNNNSESVNHVLKLACGWKKTPIVDFIFITRGLVVGAYRDLKRALVSTGEFRLAESHARFRISRTRRLELSESGTLDAHYRRFRKYVEPNTRVSTSRDGLCTVPADSVYYVPSFRGNL